MRMQDVQVGGLYHLADFRGKNGSVIMKRKVRVLETYVERDRWNGRKDGIRVQMLTENENGELVVDKRFDGSDWVKLIMAREIASVEEYEAVQRKAEVEAEERKRKQEARMQAQKEIARVMAMRLGVNYNLVEVFVRLGDPEQHEDGSYNYVPTQARINGRAVQEMMTSDPDVVLIAEIIGDIEPKVLHKMTPEQLAEHIVGGLRPEIIEEDDDAQTD